MSDIANPYQPGQPISDPALFFGRRELMATIRETLLKGRRVIVVAGAERMGKTSLLRQMPGFLAEDFVCARVELREDLQGQPGGRLDWLLWRVADTIYQQVSPHLQAEIAAPQWDDFDANTGYLLDEFWPSVRAALGERSLVLLLDDLDSLMEAERDLLGNFVAILAECRDRDEKLALVVTSSVSWQEALVRQYPRLFGGAPLRTLTTLSSEDATRLITWPVDGVLTYDFGVARRLIEVSSGQPYYLQLLCFEVFNRCAPAGWVNQRDVDLVVDDLVGREIADFRQVWEESAPPEQAALAALVSLRGARGVATTREVRTILTKAGARVTSEQVSAALESLAARGILERLGALSYRFRVGLLRDWLVQRIDLEEVARRTRWDASGRGKALDEPRVARLRPRRDRRGRRETATGEDEQEESAPPRHPAWLWIAAVVFLLAVAGIVALLLRGSSPVGPEPTQAVSLSPTSRRPTATMTPGTTVTALVVADASPTVTPVPEPTATPSPTPPLVIARSVPSIAYQSLGQDQDEWLIYVMSSDGSERTPLTEGQSGFLSAPSWSPDGAQLAFAADREGVTDIWLMDLEGDNQVNLTQDEAKDHSPAWSPDGDWIAFASLRDSLYWELYLMRVDGTEVRRLTWWEDASDLSPTWSPDGSRLAFASKRDGNWEIYTMDRDGGNLVRLTDHPDDDTNPAWSPDGGRIAFVSTREGYAEIYILPVAGGEPINISNAPYSSEHGPTWSPDGGRLAFYSDRDGEWDIYVMTSDGADAIKLTGENSIDQVPAWRP
jgi:TolB protein